MQFTVTDLGDPTDLSDNPEVIEIEMNSKPMAVDEVIHELKVTGGSFVVFTNSDTEQTNVLYRRNDGNFGLIRT